LERVLSRVGRASVATVAIALGLAVAAHGALAVTGASMRASVKRVERVALSIAAPAEEIVAASEPPPPEAPPVEAAGSSAPSPAPPSLASPAPLAPRSLFAGVAGVPGGLGGAGGGLGGGGSRSPVAATDQARPAPVAPPRVLTRAAPDYPPEVRARGVEGYVVVQALVDVQGRVAEARVVESQPTGTFDAAALAAVRRFSFAPAREGQTPVQAWVRQRFRFVRSGAPAVATASTLSGTASKSDPLASSEPSGSRGPNLARAP
jgi:protein TonB